MQSVAPLSTPPTRVGRSSPPDPDRDKVLRRYFALLRETMPSELVPIAPKVRAAFQRMQPGIPGSCKDWNRNHAVQAVAAILLDGPKLWTRTVEKMRLLSPATAEEIAELYDLVDKADIDARRAGQVWGALKSCVSPWIQAEIEHLRREIGGGG